MKTPKTMSLAALVGAALLLAGCVAPASEPTPSRPQSSPTANEPSPAPTPPSAVDPVASMSLEQRVGQLFMVGSAVSDPDPITLEAVSEQHVAGVFLHGRSSAGAAPAADFVRSFTQAHAEGDPPLWVATDQEGGDVQVLSGPGFDDIPTALTQARNDAGTLRADATRWGAQLAGAGVNMNLAPVADIVTSPEAGRQNPPIGALNREYGFDQSSVATKAGAFAAGMRASQVMPTFKHFPGLGRVDRNTDTSAGVVDQTVGADSPDVAVYGALLAEGPAVVMMSTAVYTKIDPSAPAAFSPAAIAILRDQLGFDGVITTDDLSAAAQVKPWSPADRATLSIDAGVDLLLVSADPSVFPEMYQAVLSRARSDEAFAAKVDAAVGRILAAKSPTG